MPPIKALLVLTSCFVWFVSGRVSARLDGDEVGNEPPTAVHQIPDITIDDQALRLGLSNSMKQSLDLIDRVKTLPSCAKVASSALLHSCSALDGSIEREGHGLQRGSDLFVEEEADIYAARLAVCELNGARFVIPTECQSFIPTEQQKKSRGIRGFWNKRDVSEPRAFFQYYDDITEKHLEDCRQALGSTPQAWISYSNNRQNAVVMCHAMRSQIEKDEQLHVAKILSKTAAASSESLQDALRQASLFKQQFHELTEAMPSFQVQLAEDNANLQNMLVLWWKNLKQLHAELGTAGRDVDALRQTIREANDEASSLASNALSATTSALDVKKVMSSTYEDVGELSRAVDVVSELINYVLEIRMQELTKATLNATKDMELVNSMMPELQYRVNALMQASTDVREEFLSNRQEQQAYHKDTLASIERLKNEAEDMGKQMFRKALGGVQGYLRETWTGVAVIAFKFAGVCAVTTLLGFGAWEKLIGFSFFGNLCGSFACGLVLATLFTLWSDRLSFSRLVLSGKPSSDLDFYAFFAASCCCTIVVFVCRGIRVCTGQLQPDDVPSTAAGPLYDPACAPYLDYVPLTASTRTSRYYLPSRSKADKYASL